MDRTLRLTAKLRSKKDKVVDLAEFRELSRRNGGMLYPAFTLQANLREKVIGNKFWAFHENKRSLKHDCTYWPPSVIIRHGGNLKSILEAKERKDAKRRSGSTRSGLTLCALPVDGVYAVVRCAY